MKPSRYYRLTQAMQILSGAIMASSVLFSGAGAHEAIPTAAKPLGWAYPVSCCSGIDCGEIPARTVTEGPDGYRVHLEPGDHQFVKESVTYLVPYETVKPSPDGMYHICINLEMKLLCFFAGARGF